jgi:hypothetical protein
MSQVVDIGVALKSPSSTLMSLVNINHDMDWSDFDDVVKFLEQHLDDVINEVHALDKLLLDDGKTQLNCPPKPDDLDSHGNLLLKTISEKEGDHGITLKREFKVHDMGIDPDESDNHLVEIREDIVKAPVDVGPPIYSENLVTVSICRKPTK